MNPNCSTILIKFGAIPLRNINIWTNAIIKPLVLASKFGKHIQIRHYGRPKPSKIIPIINQYIVSISDVKRTVIFVITCLDRIAFTRIRHIIINVINTNGMVIEKACFKLTDRCSFSFIRYKCPNLRFKKLHKKKGSQK